MRFVIRARRALPSLVIALLICGCESIVGIEDIAFVDRPGEGDAAADSGPDGTPGTGDGGASSCAALEQDAPCSGGIRGEGSPCAKVGDVKTCCVDFFCVYTPGGNGAGRCCPLTKACAGAGARCSGACDCASGVCSGGQCTDPR